MKNIKQICQQKGFKKIIGLILIIVFFAGFITGFICGTATTIKAVAQVTKGFMDEGMINQAIFQYRNQINACFNKTALK